MSNSNLEIFNYILNNNKIPIRSFLDLDYNIWFVAKDIATCLGYTENNTAKAIRIHVDEEDKITFEDFKKKNKIPENVDSRLIMINESGLYSLALTSKLESAKKFKRWVTKDVLPSIRKRGFYKIEEDNKRLSTENINLKEMLNSLNNNMLDIKDQNNNLSNQNNQIINQNNQLLNQNVILEQKIDTIIDDVVDNSNRINVKEQFIIVKLLDQPPNKDETDMKKKYQYHKIRCQRRNVNRALEDLKTKYGFTNINDRIVLKINYIPNSVMFGNKIRDVIEGVYISSYGNLFNIINDYTIEELRNKIYEINDERYNL